ncbi:hypothetical protein BSKO_01757 [Bryopsis sp. KO-2023]|nr:hypothetical protein BSKO_01757 [Bryopsis sp. KO-2023]
MNRKWFKEKANAALKEGARFLNSRVPKDFVTSVSQSFTQFPREVVSTLMGAQPSALSQSEIPQSGSRAREWRPGGAVDDGVYHPTEFTALEKLLSGIRSEQVRKEFSAIDEGAYTDTEEIRLWVGTYNVNGRKAPDTLDLSNWIQAWEQNWPAQPGQENPATGADICVMGFQEVVPLNAQNIISGWKSAQTSTWDTAIDKVLNPWKDFSTIFPSDSDAANKQENYNVIDLLQGWAVPTGSQNLDVLEASGGLGPNGTGKTPGNSKEDDSLQQTRSRGLEKDVSFALDRKNWEEVEKPEEMDLPRDDEFVQLISRQLVGLYLTIWVRRRLLPKISGVQTTCVATGAMGYLANKGAIAARMRVNDSSLVVLTSHFASGDHQGDEVRRNLDFSEIMRRAEFPHEIKVGIADDMNGIPEGADQDIQRAYLGGHWGGHRRIHNHENIVWFGDLNYRIKANTAAVIQTIRGGKMHQLYDHDELLRERNAGRVFKGFKEGPVTFDPTYKYVRGTNFYTGEYFDEGSSSSSDDPEEQTAKTGSSSFSAMFDAKKKPLELSSGAKTTDDLVSRLNLSSRGAGAAAQTDADIPRGRPPVARFRSERVMAASAPGTPPGSPKNKKKSKKPKKIRTPSWTDRVLYYSSGKLHHLLYGACGELTTSDHKPVSAAFLFQSRRFDRQAVEERVEQCRQIVNKRELANIPRCSVEPGVLQIGKVGYKETVEHQIVAKNVGEVSATFGFIPPPDPVRDALYCKLGALPQWVTASPLAGEIAPGEQVEIKITIRVTGGKWGSANEIAGFPDCSMDEVLVMRIEGGSDFFINLSGTYIPSCFGLSLEHLASRPQPNNSNRSLRSHRVDLASMRNRTSDPLELVKSFDAENNHSMDSSIDMNMSSRTLAQFASITRTGAMKNLVEGPIGEMIPSQLSRMLHHVCEKNRLMTPGIFVEGLDELFMADRTGIKDSDVALIRRCLDNGTPFPAQISANHMAKAILSFFRDLPEPLIPESVAHAVEDTQLSNERAISLTKEAMSAIEWGVMRTTLEILRTALTEEYAAENKLTISSVSRVLAEVWFQTSAVEPGANYSEDLLMEIAAKESMYTERRAKYMEGFLEIPGDAKVGGIQI